MTTTAILGISTEFLERIKYIEERINNFDEKIKNLENLMTLNGELLTYLSNKWDKFIKQVEEDNTDGK